MKQKLALSMLIIILSICGCGNSQETKTVGNNVISTNKTVEQTSYVAETNYSGADVPAELYEIPFQKTDDYIRNLDLSKQLSSDEMREYIISATDYLKTIYGNSYISIAADQDSFLNAVNGRSNEDGYVAEMNDQENVSDHGSELIQMYVDNKVDASVEYKTDKSLLYVEYDGKYGYVKEDLLTENPDDIKDATETMTSIDSSDVEILYPASHYFDTYDYMAINALAQFTSDGRDDNYVIVCCSDPIVVNGGELMIAAENGVEDVSIQYSKDKQNTDVYLKIPTSDSAKDANIDLSFEFGNNSIIFKNDRFDRKILIGLPADRYENVKMGDKTYTASEDNIVWIETASPSDITFTVIPQNVIYGTDSDNESTESMEIPDLKKTSKKHDYKWMYVSIGIIAVLLICIKSIISKVNKNRMKKK